MSTFFKTIARCKCTEINKTKLKTMNIVRDWINSEINRCVALFAKGYTLKKVYKSFDSNINSVYKAKIVNSASFYFKTHYKGKRRKSSKTYFISGCNKGWIPEKCIRFFDIERDYSKKHQLRVGIKLPFEIDGKNEIILSAEVPRKFWKRIKQFPLYKKGFHLCIYRQYIEINLISKIEVSNVEGSYIKSIYVSPYGGLHIASMRDIEYLNDVHHVSLKDYYECYYGVSRESDEMIKLLENIRSFENKKDFKKNLKKLEVKCKTRVNKLFKTFDSQASSDKIYHKIVVANVIEGNSKITNYIQDVCNHQIMKNCVLRGIKYEEEVFSKDELELEAKYTMRKAEREALKNNKIKNKFKAAAILKKKFSYLLSKNDNTVKIGVVKYQKSERFSKNSYVEIAQQDDYSSQLDEDEIVFI